MNINSFNLDAQEFGALHQTVHTNGEVLAGYVDISSVKQRQHAVRLQFLQVLVVCNLNLVAQVNDVGYIIQVLLLFPHSLLYATVEVDGQHALRSC